MVSQKVWRRLIGLGVCVLLYVVACQPSQSTPPTAAPSPQEVAAAPPATTLAVGTNLAGISDWSTEVPFIDAFKSARDWIPQCDRSDPGCDGEWSTEEYDRIDLDDHGWVKSLPGPNAREKFTQVSTLLLLVESYPPGEHVVLYEGEGEIEYDFDATKNEAASQPGRDVIDINPTGKGVLLTITATDPNNTGNYIRNIHVVPAAYEDSFAADIFNPQFIEHIRRFKALRFMDWMDTNDSEQGEWDQRPRVEDASYSSHGVPLEIMLELANQLQMDPWFCMPHQATDEYVRNFAEMVKANLDPALTAYVEFSNEVWNWQFDQAQYALEQGKKRWRQEGDAFAQWYGMRAAQVSDIWHGVFADAPERLMSVISTQTRYEGLEESILECPLWVAEGNAPCYQHGFEVYAITGYFNGGIDKSDHAETVESWLNDRDDAFEKAFRQIETGDVITEAKDKSLVGVRDSFQYHQQVARDHGLKLVAYEGGQHLVNSKNETLTEFLIEMNRHPRMYDMYRQLFDDWVAVEGDLFMHFSDISKPTKWGSWGLLESAYQASSPKYKAVLDFIDTLEPGA